MHHTLAWLWQRLTAERLAVAVFLAVAVGLWWGMQSQPEQVIVFQTDKCDPELEFSPDGTLCLVKEQRDLMERVQGNAPPYPWQHRLRVFEVGTGRELWRWDSCQQQVWEKEWTRKNQLVVLIPTGSSRQEGMPAMGRLLGFDPRAGQAPFFQHEWPASERSDYLLLAPDGNLMALVHSPADATCHIELADMRSGVVKSFLHTRGAEGWYWPFEFSAVWPWQFTPDGTALLCVQRQNEGIALLLYDVPTGTLRQRFRSDSRVLRRHPAPAHLPYMHSTDLVISPDGRLLAACHDQQSAHDSVRVWDLATGQLRATLDGFRPQRQDAEGKPVKWGVGNLLFTPDSSRLCVGVGRVDYGSGGEGVFGTSELHLFETRTFGRLGSMDAYYPQVSSDSRHVTFLRQQPASHDVMVLDVWTERAAPAVLVPDAGVSDFGFIPSGGPHDLHFVRADHHTNRMVPWFQQVRGWLGLLSSSDRAIELTFRTPHTGQQYDQWTFYRSRGKPPLILAPRRDRLLVHFPQGNDWHRLEFYSLPPRRPWFYILAGAAIAALVVEVLGLAWRWARRKVASRRMVAASGAAGMVGVAHPTVE